MKEGTPASVVMKQLKVKNQWIMENVKCYTITKKTSYNFHTFTTFTTFTKTYK